MQVKNEQFKAEVPTDDYEIINSFVEHKITPFYGGLNDTSLSV